MNISRKELHIKLLERLRTCEQIGECIEAEIGRLYMQGADRETINKKINRLERENGKMEGLWLAVGLVRAAKKEKPPSAATE